MLLRLAAPQLTAATPPLPKTKPKMPRKRMRCLASQLTKVKGRSRIQRAFFRWLIRNRDRLAFDLLIEGRTDRCVEFSFAGINKAISAYLNTYEFNVLAETNEGCWDILISADAYIEKSNNRYFCRWCHDSFREGYLTREEFWVGEIFEPFLTWVNSELVNARWLGLYQPMARQRGPSC